MKHSLIRKILSPFYVMLISIVVSEAAYIWASSYTGDAITFFWLALTGGVAGTLSFSFTLILVRMLSKIEKQRNELERLNQLNQELFSTISHDVRSPLTSISMVLDLATSEKISMAESVDLLQDLFLDIDHLINFLDELLSWSKHQIDNKPLIPETLCINEIISTTIQLYKRILEKKNVLVEMDKISGEVFADRGSFSFVVRNVLQNAIKFTGDGGSINISVVDFGQEIATVISDTGMGMDPQKVNEILNKGTYTSTRGTNQEKGTGFGLQASISYLEKQNGRLEIQSQRNKGTTVSIILPKTEQN